MYDRRALHLAKKVLNSMTAIDEVDLRLGLSGGVHLRIFIKPEKPDYSTLRFSAVLQELDCRPASEGQLEGTEIWVDRVKLGARIHFDTIKELERLTHVKFRDGDGSDYDGASMLGGSILPKPDDPYREEECRKALARARWLYSPGGEAAVANPPRLCSGVIDKWRQSR